MLINELTTFDIQENKIILIPIGSIEQHGPHLPLTTDTVIANYICLKIDNEMKNDVIVYPPIYYTLSIEHIDFPGTVSTKPITFLKYIYSILYSIYKTCKPKLIVLVNAHGGNKEILDLVTRIWNYRHRKCKVLHYYIYNRKVVEYVKSLLKIEVVNHAALIETMLIAYIDKNLVKWDRISEITTGIDLKLFKTIELSKTGILGQLNIRYIDLDKSKLIIQFIINDLKNTIQNIINKL